MSSYRDDLEAAQARADAAEREAALLKQKLEDLQRPRIDEGPAIPIPEKFKIQRWPNAFEVSWSWFKPQHVFMLFFAIAWDAFLLFWYFGPTAGQGGLLFKIFPIAHVAVGVGITYQVLTGFLNRTRLQIGQGVLRVRHGPLPWKGNHTLDRNDIRQLFVTAGKEATWEVRAVLDSGKELTLVQRLETQPQADYLETVFEQHLGIVDHRVAGEA